MSLLIFEQFRDSVLVVTDTLVSDENRRPVDYQHKVWHIGHLRILMAMTGTALIGDIWCRRMLELFPEDAEPATDIETVNEVAQEELARIHRELEQKIGPHGTSTIYMFGFETASGDLVRYIYRSVLGYEPERFVGEQFALKPAPQSFDPELPSTQDELVGLAIKMRHENDNNLSPEPVAIGGDLVATFMSADGIGNEAWHRFSDYEELRARMA